MDPSTHLNGTRGQDVSDIMARISAETVSLGVILGHIVGWLPSIATLLAICWYLVNIWESPSVKAVRARWSGK